MTMITPSYLGETIEYSSLHACRSTLEDPTTDCHHHPTFEIHRDGDQLTLDADPGADLAGHTAKLHWHLDGNTDCSVDADKPSEPKHIVRRAGDAGAYVTLCITDPIRRKATGVTHLVPVDTSNGGVP